ncbi:MULTISPECIES: urease accessory protein UreE [Aphanothece]|uniref:urease accessory protein UreE n=1 Tax=Aphanothece TaxID=1121 RepID=UPI0039846929
MIPAASSGAPAPAPLLLNQRLGDGDGRKPSLRLALSADERRRLRGLRRSVCGRPLLLQLPRGEALQPGELLADGGLEQVVRVEAAPEPLLRVEAPSGLALLQACYHLGNRHVAIEIQAGELRLLEDPVLAHLLEHRGLTLTPIVAPFLPEFGAYATGDRHPHDH